MVQRAELKMLNILVHQIGQSICQSCILFLNQKSPTDDKLIGRGFWVCIVHLTGLEPAHRKTPDPKSGASTNFATGALVTLRFQKSS